MEASRSRIPLIVVTADRPDELHGRGAPQTADQSNLFSAFVRRRIHKAAPAEGVGGWWADRLAAQLLDAATGPHPGPVHLNIAFRKPLYTSSDVEAMSPVKMQTMRGEAGLSDAQYRSIADVLNSASRGAIVVGPVELAHQTVSGIDPETQALAILRLAQCLGWPVVAEPASQVRFQKQDGSAVVSSGDALFRDAGLAAKLQPDVVLQFGGAPTSRAVLRWMGAAEEGAGGDGPNRDITMIAVDVTGEWHDPGANVSTVVAMCPVSFCEALRERIPNRSMGSWAAQLCELDNKADALMKRAASVGLWEAPLVRALVDAVPEGGLLHVASSMAIRDLDSFSSAIDRTIRVSANRGLNGIDGTISTVVGQASAWKSGPVVALMGDLAFLHDVAALGLLRDGEFPEGLTLVVSDNGGGGIFEYLPIASGFEGFEERFVTPQPVDLAQLCRGYDVPVHEVRDRQGLRDAFGTIGQPGYRVVHIAIDRAQSVMRHQELWKDVSVEVGQ